MKTGKSTLYNDLNHSNLTIDLDLNEALSGAAISERYGHYRPDDQDAERCFQRSVDQNDSVIAAIEGRDEGAVVELVFHHLELSRQNMEKFTPLQRGQI